MNTRILSLVIVSIVISAAVGVMSFYFYYIGSPPPSPTQTNTPIPPISFEEAVGYALNLDLKEVIQRWIHYGAYRRVRGFEGETFVTPDGLVEGHFEWRASNGSLYAAEYLNGEISDEVERFTGVEDAEEYYVWRLTLSDGGFIHIDARNGDILIYRPGRFPGVLIFETAVRVVSAPQKIVDEWKVQEYKRIGDYEGSYETLDGRVKGHLLWRVSNGTLYEVKLPLMHVPFKERKVLIIDDPNDKDEYNVWEISTENETYYIDGRNGVIRLIIPK